MSDEWGKCDECSKPLTEDEHDRDVCSRCGHFVHDPMEDYRRNCVKDQGPYRFVFEFHHENHPDGEDALFVYLFPFVTDHEKAYDLGCESDEFLEKTGELEEFGVHDFCTTGKYELVGFGSYEIEPKNWLPVVQKWRDWFIEQGVGCGDIEEMTRAEYERRYWS